MSVAIGGADDIAYDGGGGAGGESDNGHNGYGIWIPGENLINESKSRNRV